MANDLGISRVQFRRYLAGTSFPKPQVLERICEYFSVDARILTEHLDERLLLEMQIGQSQRFRHATAPSWLEAMSFACPDQDFFTGPHDLEDGLYFSWHNSKIKPGQITNNFVQVKTLNRARIVRGFEKPEFDLPTRSTRADREYKGICLRQGTGYSIIQFHPEPGKIVSHTYLSPVNILNSDIVFVGMSTIGRVEVPGFSRHSRVVWTRILPTCADILRHAHIPFRQPPANVPDGITSILSVPVG